MWKDHFLLARFPWCSSRSLRVGSWGSTGSRVIGQGQTSGRAISAALPVQGCGRGFFLCITTGLCCLRRSQSPQAADTALGKYRGQWATPPSLHSCGLWCWTPVRWGDVCLKHCSEIHSTPWDALGWMGWRKRVAVISGSAGALVPLVMIHPSWCRLPMCRGLCARVSLLFHPLAWLS